MNYKKGFTLIELLVVIAIIGILSSVVLASLNTARDKGADAAAKSNLNGARAQAELYYDSNSYSYASLCTSSTGIAKQLAAATSSVADSSAIAEVCQASSTAWGAEVKLKASTKYYCVDSTGYAGEVNASAISAGDGSCL